MKPRKFKIVKIIDSLAGPLDYRGQIVELIRHEKEIEYFFFKKPEKDNNGLEVPGWMHLNYDTVEEIF